MTEPRPHIFDEKTIYRVIISPTSHYYATFKDDEIVDTWHTLKRAAAANPTFTRTDVVHSIALPVVVESTTAVTSAGEKLYLACENCGEVFEANEIQVAVDHELSCARDHENWDKPLYKIVLESEAF